MAFQFWFKCVFLILQFIVLPICTGVTIYEPETIPPLEFGSQNEVILQCDYDISDSEKGQLDLKWYFNDEVTPFLQWIPGGDRRPQLIEPTPFLGHVDLNYKIEDTEDENKAYKDLKILDLTPQMAGNYLCKVSTFEDEGYVHQQLNIFAPPKRVTLDHHYDTSEQSLNFSCGVEQVFPKPVINIIMNDNHLPLEEYNVLTDEYEVENGLYDVNLVLEDVNVNEGNEISLGCEITLPAPYDVTLKEELRINLLDFKSQESEDSVASGDDDCLFCDLEAGSGSGETVLEENEYDEEASGDSNILDYDNDWLNIYNDTEVASGSCESNCDTIEASGDEDYIVNVADDSSSGDDEDVEALSPKHPLPTLIELVVSAYILRFILW